MSQQASLGSSDPNARSSLAALRSSHGGFLMLTECESRLKAAEAELERLV